MKPRLSVIAFPLAYSHRIAADNSCHVCLTNTGDDKR
jgi:hypothetical protein